MGSDHNSAFGFPIIFGPYVLLAPLSRGALGQVCLAITGQQEGETLCVVKRVMPQSSDDEETAARFVDEARQARRLHHDALVATLAAGRVGNQPYIAQELVDGRNLSEVSFRCASRDMKIPFAVSIHIVREVARALEYGHTFGGLQLAHRDLSQATIRLGFAGEVKLLDFGVATSRLGSHFIEEGRQWGSSTYMAPEQAAGGAVDRRVDIFALGVVLWELLVGKEITSLPSEVLLRRAPVPAPSSLNPSVPAGLDAIISRAIAADPAARFQSAGEMRTALATFASSNGEAKSSVAQLLGSLFETRKERDSRRRMVDDARPLLAEALRITPPAEPTPPPEPIAVRAATAPSPDAEKQPEQPSTPAPVRVAPTPMRMALILVGLAVLATGAAGLWWWSHADTAGLGSHRATPTMKAR